MAELNSHNCSQYCQEGPQAIAGGRQVPEKGELILEARNWVCKRFPEIRYFYRFVLAFEIEIATGKIEE
jgi:hypothetical protein